MGHIDDVLRQREEHGHGVARPCGGGWDQRDAMQGGDGTVQSAVRRHAPIVPSRLYCFWVLRFSFIGDFLYHHARADGTFLDLHRFSFFVSVDVECFDPIRTSDCLRFVGRVVACLFPKHVAFTLWIENRPASGEIVLGSYDLEFSAQVVLPVVVLVLDFVLRAMGWRLSSAAVPQDRNAPSLIFCCIRDYSAPVSEYSNSRVGFCLRQPTGKIQARRSALHTTEIDKRNGPSAMAAGIHEPELAGDSIREGGALFSFLEVVGGVVFVLGFRNPSCIFTDARAVVRWRALADVVSIGSGVW
ncbi:hypothetical protein K438DRAFT_1771315 [Mycena galopus ATCC 62051]|nr:hypothetical protein K438DRAFT_1771315 [Mycena galopus ATCC 62051]